MCITDRHCTDGLKREPAQRAINALLKRKNQAKTQIGWDYTLATGRNDSSATGWCVMACETAYAANLTVGNGLDGAAKWFEQTYALSNPERDRYTMQDQARFAYAWKGDKLEGALDRVPMGLLSAVFLGHHQGDKALETMVNFSMANQLPTKWPTNVYYLYYNTLAIYQAHGAKKSNPIWKRWNEAMLDTLVQAQRREACFEGSWDAAPFIGSEIGRTLTTAYCCLTLEASYRYGLVARE